MNVGFTGTQKGMTKAQYREVELVLQELMNEHSLFSDAAPEFHHGDCVGADAQAHSIADALGFYTIAHPCNLTAKRAYTTNDETMEVRPPLDRNHIIVDSVAVLIVAPYEHSEVLRSGTWSTWRYAKKKYKEIILVYPDGSRE